MNRVKSNRGAFIVFEGCDRSGKSTQCQKLIERLKKEGFRSEQIMFPDRTTCIGKLIDNYVTKKVEFPDQTIHLLFSANRWENESKMRQLLLNGVTLVADRYSFSGVAYSSAKGGMSIEWCQEPDRGLPKPDKVFFLDTISGCQRSGFGEERYENTEFQRKVYDNFLKLKDDSWMIIDADQSIDDIHREIFEHAMTVIKETQSQDLKTLW